MSENFQFNKNENIVYNKDGSKFIKNVIEMKEIKYTSVPTIITFDTDNMFNFYKNDLELFFSIPQKDLNEDDLEGYRFGFNYSVKFPFIRDFGDYLLLRKKFYYYIDFNGKIFDKITTTSGEQKTLGTTYSDEGGGKQFNFVFTYNKNNKEYIFIDVYKNLFYTLDDFFQLGEDNFRNYYFFLTIFKKGILSYEQMLKVIRKAKASIFEFSRIEEIYYGLWEDQLLTKKEMENFIKEVPFYGSNKFKFKKRDNMKNLSKLTGKDLKPYWKGFKKEINQILLKLWE